MRLIVGMILLLGLLVPLGVGAQERGVRLDDLVDHFAKVVFGAEMPELATQPAVISKWRGLVAIKVQGRSTPRLIALASRHIKRISQLTGIAFRSFQPGEKRQSIDLVFLKRAEMGNIKGANLDRNVIRAMANDPSMACYFLAWHNPPERIVKALVVVDVEHSDDSIDSCLLEDLTQVMGLPNDVESPWPSIFAQHDQLIAYSKWDELYLRTLYDPRLKPGMNEAQARVVVRKIFAKALAR